MNTFECKGESCSSFEKGLTPSCEAINRAIGALPGRSVKQTGTENEADLCPREVLEQIRVEKPVRANLVLLGAERLDNQAAVRLDDAGSFQHLRAAQTAAETVTRGNELQEAAAADVMQLAFQTEVQKAFPISE